MISRPVILKSTDNFELPGLLFEPDHPIAACVIHPATGVPYKYYAPFAEWLSETHNRVVLIYAYRDSDDPSPTELRNSKTVMSDWGIADQSAGLDFMVENYPNLELHTIGHSLGGFCVPYHKNANRIVSHTGVNSGLAYWPAHPLRFIVQVIMFWFVLGPVSTKLLGYLPGQFLGMKNGIPSGVYWQWRRWCTNEKFYEPDWGKTLPKPDLHRFTGNLKLFSCTDDVFIPTSRVEALARYFPAASSKKLQVLTPAEFGIKSIGHIQIFSKKCSMVWPSLID